MKSHPVRVPEERGARTVSTTGDDAKPPTVIDAAARGIRLQNTTGASIRDLYHFASTADSILIALAFGLFLAAGSINSAMNLVQARVLDVAATDSLDQTGLRVIELLGGYVGGGMFVVFTLASCFALHTRHKMMAKWRVAFVRAVLRQDIGWFDVNQGQQLAGLMCEALPNSRTLAEATPLPPEPPAPRVPAFFFLPGARRWCKSIGPFRCPPTRVSCLWAC